METVADSSVFTLSEKAFALLESRSGAGTITRATEIHEDAEMRREERRQDWGVEPGAFKKRMSMT